MFEQNIEFFSPFFMACIPLTFFIFWVHAAALLGMGKWNGEDGELPGRLIFLPCLVIMFPVPIAFLVLAVITTTTQKISMEFGGSPEFGFVFGVVMVLLIPVSYLLGLASRYRKGGKNE